LRTQRGDSATFGLRATSAGCGLCRTTAINWLGTRGSNRDVAVSVCFRGLPRQSCLSTENNAPRSIWR
jgi:hypothetical protein